jgi:hypothetical protein
MHSPRLVGSAMLLSLLFGALETRAEDAFVGAWTVSFTPDSASVTNGAKPFKDAALFHNNELSSEAFAMYGFHTVAYNVPDGASSTFTASMTSESQGTLQWTGRREGGRLVGVLQWSKPNGTTLKYTLAGEPLADSDP